MKSLRRTLVGIVACTLLTAGAVRAQTILSSTDGNSGYKCAISGVSVSAGVPNGTYSATYNFCDQNGTCGSLGSVNFTVASHVATINSQSNLQIDATTNFGVGQAFRVSPGTVAATPFVETIGGNHTVQRQDCVPDGHGGWVCPGLCCGAVFTDSTTMAVTAPSDINTVNFVYTSCATIFGEPFYAYVNIGSDYFVSFPMFGTSQTNSYQVPASVSGGMNYNTTLSNARVAFFNQQGGGRGNAVVYNISGGSGTIPSGGGHTITVAVFASGCPNGSPTPTPSPTATASVTPTPTPTPIPTPSSTPTPTPIGTATPAPTAVPVGTPGSITPVTVPGGGTKLAADMIIDNPSNIYGPIVDGLNALRDTHGLGGQLPTDADTTNRGHLDDLQGQADSIVSSVNSASTSGQSGLNSAAMTITAGWSSASFGSVSTLNLPLSYFNSHYPTGISVPSFAGTVRTAVLWVLVGCWYWIAGKSIMAMRPGM